MVKQNYKDLCIKRPEKTPRLNFKELASPAVDQANIKYAGQISRTDAGKAVWT